MIIHDFQNYSSKKEIVLLSETRILNSHYMYARHKPGHMIGK